MKSPDRFSPKLRNAYSSLITVKYVHSLINMHVPNCFCQYLIQSNQITAHRGSKLWMLLPMGRRNNVHIFGTNYIQIWTHGQTHRRLCVCLSEWPRREAGDFFWLPPVWNLRAVSLIPLFYNNNYNIFYFCLVLLLFLSNHVLLLAQFSSLFPPKSPFSERYWNARPKRSVVPACPNFICHLVTRAIPMGLTFGLC